MNISTLMHYFPIENPTWIFFVVLCIILLAPMILGRLHIPHIIGMVLAGVLVGEYGLNILKRDNSFELFGRVGLYYIMFVAALSMDLGGLKRNLMRGLSFGALTFIIPFFLGGIVAFYGLHYNVGASLLLACILSSHTLVSFPIVTRYGLVKHVSVTLSIGSTMLALLLSLLILAGIAGYYTGSGSPGFWVELGLKCILFCVGIFLFYPRLIRWFLRKFADNVLQYIFVLCLVFFSAAVSELCGLEGIFGAFLSGLIFNRYIPQASPLMNRIDFVGNALFIPYFLIGVGMLINVKLLFESHHVLLIVLLIVGSAIITKWLAAKIGSMMFGLDGTSGLMMFGLTSAHAAGALAMVMVGRNLEIAPHVYLMSDEVLNAVVMLILFSCLVSSFATEAAARKLVVSGLSKEEKLGDNERILVAFSNPNMVSPLTNLALMMRNVKSDAPLVGVSVVIDNKDAIRAQEVGRKELLEAAGIAAAADVKMKKITRLTTNVANGIVHTLREFDASELLMGLHSKQRISDSYFGSITPSLLVSTSRQIMIFRPAEPVNTLRKIHVVVPEKADYEVGFTRWVDRLSRLAAQLECRISYYSKKNTLEAIERYEKKKYPVVRAEFIEMDEWKDTLALSGKVNYDHLLVIITARKGTLSYQPIFERLPQQLERSFSINSLLVVYPDQLGSESSLPSGFRSGLSKDSDSVGFASLSD